MLRSRALGLAVAISLAVHLGLVAAPDWRKNEEPRDAPRLLARMAPASPAPAEATAAVKPSVPMPQRRKPRATQPPAPDATVAQMPAESPPAAPQEPPADAESAPISTDQPVGGSLEAGRPADERGPASSGETTPEASAASKLPRQGRVIYQGFASLLAGEGEVSWKHDGQILHSRLGAGLRGLGMSFTYTSTGRVSGLLVVSETTRDDRRGKVSEALIDTAAGTVIQKRGEDTRTRPISGAAIALSALPQLLAVLDEGVEAAAVFIVGDYWVEDSTIVNLGVETLSLDSASVATRHFRSRTRDGKVIDIWLAPDWKNAPARIRIETGTVVDLKAVEVEIDGVVLLRRAPSGPTSFRLEPDLEGTVAGIRAWRMG